MIQYVTIFPGCLVGTSMIQAWSAGLSRVFASDMLLEACRGDGFCYGAIPLIECTIVSAQYHIPDMCVSVCVCVCVCVFIKLHITTQSGPVILVILCHSH